MASRPLTLLIVLLVTLDPGSPLLSGAVGFDPTAFVEGIPAQHPIPLLRHASARAPASARTEARDGAGVAARRLLMPASGAWLVDLALARSNLFEPPPVTDDHGRAGIR
jgi:hypothetical protein